MKFKNIEILLSIAFFMCDIPLLYWKVNWKLLLLQFSKQFCPGENCFHICVVRKLRQNIFKIKTKITVLLLLTKMRFQRIL